MNKKVLCFLVCSAIFCAAIGEAHAVDAALEELKSNWDLAEKKLHDGYVVMVKVSGGKSSLFLRFARLKGVGQFVESSDSDNGANLGAEETGKCLRLVENFAKGYFFRVYRYGQSKFRLEDGSMGVDSIRSKDVRQRLREFGQNIRCSHSPYGVDLELLLNNAHSTFEVMRKEDAECVISIKIKKETDQFRAGDLLDVVVDPRFNYRILKCEWTSGKDKQSYEAAYQDNELVSLSFPDTFFESAQLLQFNWKAESVLESDFVIERYGIDESVLRNTNAGSRSRFWKVVFGLLLLATILVYLLFRKVN